MPARIVPTPIGVAPYTFACRGCVKDIDSAYFRGPVSLNQIDITGEPTVAREALTGVSFPRVDTGLANVPEGKT